MAKTPRGWTGARTPSAIKRVRQAERRRAINQPRRTAAKTYATNAVKVATGAAPGDVAEALAQAMSALDKAAKVGVIHPNNAARRKSRLVLRLNAIAAGDTTQQTGRATKTTGTAAAVKAARTRIASGKATKAKGPQTAAGKARAALSKTARAEAANAAATASVKATAPKAGAKTAPKAAAKTKAQVKPAAKAVKPAAKADKPAAKVAAPKTPAKPAAKADKPAAKAAAPKPKKP